MTTDDGRAPKGDKGVPVRIDRVIASLVKYIANHRKVTVSEVLNEILDAPVAREFRRVAMELYGDIVDEGPG